MASTKILFPSPSFSFRTRRAPHPRITKLSLFKLCPCVVVPFHSHSRLNSLTKSAPSPDAFQAALRGNKSWSQTASGENADLFRRLANSQAPQILWIGCSDSRVPETTILGLKPGDVFVHRNIANVLSPHDISSQAVIFFAVNALKVKHVVLCGHTNCGGAKAALGNKRVGGVLDGWLAPLRELRMELGPEGVGEEGRGLVDANVKRGVEVLRRNPEVIAAVEERGLKIHGVVYNVATGQLEELECGDEAEDKRKEAFKIQ
ncbi:MAG: hypothetical protein Q9167_006069 [Letrouitia subvulpina]